MYLNPMKFHSVVDNYLMMNCVLLERNRKFQIEKTLFMLNIYNLFLVSVKDITTTSTELHINSDRAQFFTTHV